MGQIDDNMIIIIIKQTSDFTECCRLKYCFYYCSLNSNTVLRGDLTFENTGFFFYETRLVKLTIMDYL